jgi:general secretion pathway protein E
VNIPAGLASLLEPAESFDARPAIEWLVAYASSQEASDLHLRPAPQALEILLRREGVLSCAFELPLQLHARLLVGLKNGARLASYKNATPQDGKWSLGEHEVRVAVAPAQFGEVAVLRLLRPDACLRGLDELGFWPEELAALQKMADQPQGLLLATGPAGSGKSTTLLALMRWLQQRHRERLGPTPGARLNVITLEDPVEVVVSDFNQTSIQSGVGMTFATGLRSILRQDPDLILVGEIRDSETAAAVVQASLSGHLVFSTLHARDSLGVVPRLLEMGVQPYQLAASLSGVIYQRLLRQLCSHCQRDGQPAGCSRCHQSGYRGRTAVPELLTVSDELRRAILDKQPLPAPDFRLRDRAELRQRKELTSEQEIARMIPL